MRRTHLVPYEKLDGLMWSLNFEIPAPCMISFTREVDLHAVEALRADCRASGRPRPSYTAVVIRAVALGLREHPYANRRVFSWPLWSRAVQFEDVDVSVAVERESTMHANPETLRAADRMSLDETSARLAAMQLPESVPRQRWAALVRLVRAVPLWLSRLLVALPRFLPAQWIRHRGGACLVTSPAKYGVDAISGFWHWPVTFSFGMVKERPVVVDGEVVPRPTTILTMVFDRRVMTGAPAARFFSQVVHHLEHPREAIAPHDTVAAHPAAARPSPGWPAGDYGKMPRSA